MAATSNPLLDDADSGQTYTHPTDGNPLTTDADVGRTVSGNAPASASGLMSRGWVSLADVRNQPSPQPSETPVRDVARDIGGSVARGSAGAADVLLNPSELVMKPLRTAGVAAWDWLAPKVGLPQMSPEQRADILGTTPQDQGPVGTALSAIPGPNPYNTPPTTEIGRKADMPIQSAIGAAALGPGGLLRRTALGAAGGGAGEAAANVVDPRYAPLVAMATNALVQGGGAALPYPGRSVDAADAAIAQRSQSQFDIPFRAPDLIPGSQMRSPGHVADLNDALRRNIVTEMGQDPNTGYAPTANKVTPTVLDATRTDTGQTFQNVGQNNNIQPGPAFNLLTRLRQIDSDIDNVTGVSDADRAIMRTRLGEIRNAVNQNTGQISGSDYLGLVAKDSRLDKLAGDANSGIANIGLQAVDALHDAMGQSLTPQDQAALTTARYRYRLMKTVEPLVAQDRTGNIDAGAFAQRVTDQSNLIDRGGRNIAYSGGGTIGALGDAAGLIARGAEPKSLNPLPYMVSPTGLLPYFLGRPPSEVAAAQLLPSVVHGLAALNQRSAPYANQVITNAIRPPALLPRVGQGLLGGAVLP